MLLRMRSLLALAGCALLSVPASAVTIDWIPIGDPGNAADTAGNCYSAGCGSVADPYRIGKYEVTNEQYAEFLTAKAVSDPLGLYNTQMAGTSGGITRSGSAGSYTYSVKAGWETKAVNWVSAYDAMRFVNWLGNGQGVGDTETGAYTLLGGTATPSNGLTVTRNAGAITFLPSENEWYKAAYYDGLSANYFDYPAGSDAVTTCAAPGGTPNTANCSLVVGNVTQVGAYVNSASPYGTFDQGGNVREWNDTIVSDTYRGVRGGTFYSVVGHLAASYRGRGDPTNEGSFLGFRVASLPEPGAMLLLITGLTGLALRQRRS
ncbi:MAG: SUMF1/EgtB/PvdO family nonheme iron enzyme [Polyangiaceae bacterium]|nr:SUMF1/EgtB/PvdO family nonheme iron enzyme [Polyangiaceae bacterium]